MKKPDPTSLVAHFSVINDPRIAKKNRHNLIDIIAIAISAVICGADQWTTIEEFAKSKEGWFRQFLELPNGIPSHDTFGRVFSLISPEEFQSCFIGWVRSICGELEGVVAIDGKTLRRSHDRRSNKSAIHVVSAFASENGLVIGQVKTDEKSNEITAIPKLLEKLTLHGCIVTIDAMGCQKAIAEKIIDRGGDYLLALKGNQSNLAEEVEDLFGKADEVDFEGYESDYYETTGKGHGRKEIRRHWTVAAKGLLSEGAKWTKLNTVAVVESERTCNGKTSSEMRYFISSIENDARTFARGARGHWAVENNLHWVLDVAFREDESRVRIGNAAENFALLRHIALNALKQDKSFKREIKGKRLRAGWDEDYLLEILTGL
jgi:predicted transposase YbfD/YdcC